MNIASNLNSLQTNQSFLNTTAKDIQNPPQNLEKNITNLIVAEKSSAVNINSIKTQDEMIGSLLDIKV